MHALRLLFWLAVLQAPAWTGCRPPPETPRAQGPLRQSVYVWQRLWSPEVVDAVSNQSPAFERVVVLAAEMTLDGAQSDIHQAEIDWNSLHPARTLGLAIRITAFRGSFDPHGPAYASLADTARRLLAMARRNNLQPAEIHLDFDCAESQLTGYARWIRALRSDLKPTRVVLTVLPAWMNRSQFAPLAAAADGWVLQVHALQRPVGPQAEFTLCDPQEAAQAVERAARFGIDFDVALPTYGYLLLFDVDGRLKDVVAEDALPGAKPDDVLREIWTDPAAMAQLVRRWQQDRPTRLKGLIWYRMPVGSDHRNWTWLTLSNVMAGHIPTPRLEPRCDPDADLSTTVRLTNTGSADARGGWRITARWSQATLIATESLPGFGLAERDPDHVTWTNLDPRIAIRSGDTLAVGWLRLAPPHPPALELEKVQFEASADVRNE